MSTERPTQSDKALWRSLAADRVASGRPCRISTSPPGWKAACRKRRPPASKPPWRPIPRCVGPPCELSEVLGMPLPAAPARLEVRAKALVGFEVEQQAARVGLFDWLFARDRRFALPRLATMTAAVIIAISGFMLGGGLGESMAQDRYAYSNQRND